MKISVTAAGRRALGGAVLLAVLGVAGCGDDIPPLFEPEGEGAIEGLLYYDADRNGTFNPMGGDFALEDVTVEVRRRNTGEVLANGQDVTGPDGRFNLTSLELGTHDLFVRFPEELGAVCQNPLPVSVFINETTSVRVAGQESCLIQIAEARELPAGEPVTVRGTVTVAKGTISTSYFWVSDGTAGIKIYAPAAPNVQRGDVVEATGLIDVPFGEHEVDASAGSVTLIGSAPVPDPIVITGAEMVSHDFQGSVVTVEDLEVTEVQDHNPGSSYNVTVSAPDGSSFILRIDSDAAITTEFAEGSLYDVTGVVSPFGGAEQLYPRSDADIVPATP